MWFELKDGYGTRCIHTCGVLAGGVSSQSFMLIVATALKVDSVW